MTPLAIHDSYLLEFASLALGFRVGDVRVDAEGNKTFAAAENSPYPLIQRPKVEVRDGICHTVIQGPMVADDTPFVTGLRSVFADVTAADASPDVRGHLIQIDTGGGYVTAGQLAYSTISSLSKPSLAHCTYACSGGVMASVACTEIMIADELTVYGSVGVMQRYPTWYLQLQPELETDLYARTSERKNEEFKALVKGDRTLSLDRLDELDAAFTNIVRKGRRGKGATLTAEATSGAVFTGRKAIQAGLADSQGNLRAAVRRLNTLIQDATR